MDKTVAREALITNAMAYYRRGNWVQYDQLSMDRALQITTRQSMKCEPEYATAQRTWFSDCASFCWTMYAVTFGYEMAAKLTWDIVKLVKPCAYFYEITGSETETEKETVRQAVRSSLETGDVLVYQEANFGHAMLYLEEGKFINCSQNGSYAGYHYRDNCSRHSEHSGLWIDDLDALLYPCEDTVHRGRHYLFSGKIQRFGIYRPLEHCDHLTENTVARMTDCRDLTCGILSSVCGGQTVSPGETVRYTVFVRNDGTAPATANITFAAADGVPTDSPATVQTTVQPGEECHAEFTVRVPTGYEPALPTPHAVVNGLRMSAPLVLTARKPAATRDCAAVKAAEATVGSTESLFRRERGSWENEGLFLPATASAMMRGLFFRYDACAGNVLCRTAQSPQTDFAVYGQFGGRDVITPDRVWNYDVRSTTVDRRDLYPGDLILVAENPLMEQIACAVWLGDALVVQEAGTASERLTGPEADRWLDGLFGRSAFVVIRPRLA